MSARAVDLTIPRGKTFEYALLYAEDESNPVYLDITGVTDTAPMTLAVPGHGLPDGWPVRVEGVRVPAELNTANRDLEYESARVIDADTLMLAGVNGSLWKPYREGGQVVFARPYDLTGCHARATVRDRVGGSVLFIWHSDPSVERHAAIEIDTETSQVVLMLDAATSADLPWRRGVYEVELIDSSGRVHPLTAISRITVSKEVTT